MPGTYKTSEVAKIIGIHPNTVRLYEEWGLIPKPERLNNGYRIFTDFHLEQFRLARTALNIEILQNGLRKKAMKIIKLSASGKLEEAETLTRNFLQQLQTERQNAEEAIEIAAKRLTGQPKTVTTDYLTRKQTADYLHITIDTLRNWELNGLLTVRRKQNRYRIYTDEDINLLKIIRTLRCANYSLTAILRMLNEFTLNPQADLKKILNTPKGNDDIISACDKLLTSLLQAEQNAHEILCRLKKMKYLAYPANPPL